MSIVGNPAVARRICFNEDAYCHLYEIADSIFSVAYSSGDTSHTSLNYGILRKWQIPVMAGIFGYHQGADFFSHTTIGSGTGGVTVIDPTGIASSASYPDSLGVGHSPVHAYYYGVEINDFFTQHYHYLAVKTTGLRYFKNLPSGGRIARQVYLQHANAAPFRAYGVATAYSGAGTITFHDPVGATAITYHQNNVPDGPPTTDSGPGCTCNANAGAGTVGPTERHIHVGALITRSDRAGFELAPTGLGGATAEGHATTAPASGGYYTDEAISQLMTAINSNTFLIMLGQNSDATTTNELQNGVTTRYRNFLNTIIGRWRTGAIAGGAANPLFLLVNPYDTNKGAIVYNTMWAALSSLATERTDCLALNLYERAGPFAAIDVPYLMQGSDHVHTTRAGSDYMATILWNMLIEAASPSRSRRTSGDIRKRRGRLTAL